MSLLSDDTKESINGMSKTLADIQNEKIVVHADFHDKDLILTLPGARWDRTQGVCTLPISWAACKQVRAIIGDRLEIGDALYKWAINEAELRVEPSLNLRQATQADLTINPDLYPFQQAGAQFLLTARHALLGDVMGSGKTVQAIAAAKYIHALPAVVVCPASMKQTWKREIEKWWPETPVYLVEGTKAKRSKTILECLHNPGIVIINWESTWRHSRLSPYGAMQLAPEDRINKELNRIPWQLIIVDEGHRMKDPQSKQTRAVWAIGNEVPWKWVLTGTPLTNTPDSLFPILHFLNSNEWPSKTKFIQRYCDHAPSRWGPGIDVFGLNENMKEEFFEIFDPRFRRLPKEVVLPNLPPIQRIRRDIDMSDEQVRSYRTMANDLVAFDENGELIIAQNPISKLTRLVQYSSACLEVKEDGKPKLVDPSNKLDQLMADLDDYLSAEESVVVFAMSRQLIEMAAKRLEKKKISYSKLVGGQTSLERQREIDNFQEGVTKVILVTIQAGGVGVTLTAARIAIFLQRPWSNVDHQQAMARVHRIGSEHHESVMIVDYVSQRTVEPYQMRVLEGKAQQLEAVVRDKETIQRLLNGEEE